MKIKSEHYNRIKQAIEAIPEQTRKNHYESLKSDTRIKDIDKRFRWDCFNYAGLTSFACNTLYNYLDDNHIDTALKSIIKEIKTYLPEPPAEVIVNL